jgi:hypothetical protein
LGTIRIAGSTLCVVLASSFFAAAATAQTADGRTFRFWSPGHGAQVEYIGPGGRAFLWYPGNRVVVPSLRRVAMIRGVPSVCHLWPPRTYNPVTRERGPGWACTPQQAWAANVVEVAPGDIFGLSRSPTTPFSLPRQPLPFAQLKAAGRGS